MCGIVGFIDVTYGGYDRQAALSSMTVSIRHRGPDDQGIWMGRDDEAALGHRRLSVIDLSSAAHQPMVSGNGRYVIVYNGEVYNFADLRAELLAEGIDFTSEGDTQVVLEACAAWGVDAAVSRFNGMFAFALWDRREKSLALALDRFSIKPLYWCEHGGVFLFGSELKSLAAHPAFRNDIDRGALAGFMRYGYVPGVRTIYAGVHKVEPGTVMTWRPNMGVNVTRYWDMREVANRGLTNADTRSEGELVEALDDVLRAAVKCRMVSDVPMGAFLSGGIDSSTITALMQDQSKVPIRTFSIGFSERGYDESGYAREVARHLGTDHTELLVTEKEAQEVILKLPSLYDEPFADSSQIPTYLVSALARASVTVALSGDGGDEMFGGYNRHVLAQRISQVFAAVPYSVRKGLGFLAASIPQFVWESPRRADKIAKLAAMMRERTVEDAYHGLSAFWNPSDPVVLNASGEIAGWHKKWPQFGGAAEKMMLLDAETYLTGDILTKVDRASMGVGLEARVPFLDYRVVQYAWRLPMSVKIRDGRGKWILRQVLDKYVPANLIERPKMGFGVPVDSWLRGDLRDWAEDLLDETRLNREGFFDVAMVRRKWDEHVSGKRNWQHQLWCVLIFQAWQSFNKFTRSV
jgi:asparagine synthase (glutamine-hydrolysing)